MKPLTQVQRTALRAIAANGGKVFAERWCQGKYRGATVDGLSGLRYATLTALRERGLLTVTLVDKTQVHPYQDWRICNVTQVRFDLTDAGKVLLEQMAS